MARFSFPSKNSSLDAWLVFFQGGVSWAIAILLVVSGFLLLFTNPAQVKLSVSLWLLAIPFVPLIPFPEWVKVVGALAGFFLLQT